eukprot:gb/GECG01010337.1/.p1 GENE.gb/GECG01010337.1/~~gb/GECG01010337.1/.p1  ORF type:complete len:974 (+),score=85.42 gb/GECG01010337.1/:1-2922(+)
MEEHSGASNANAVSKEDVIKFLESHGMEDMVQHVQQRLEESPEMDVLSNQDQWKRFYRARTRSTAPLARFIYQKVQDLITWAFAASDVLRPWILEAVFPVFVIGVLELRAALDVVYARKLLNEGYKYFAAWHSHQLERLHAVLEINHLDIPSPMGLSVIAEQRGRDVSGADARGLLKVINSSLKREFDVRFLLEWLDPSRQCEVYLPRIVHKMFLSYVTVSGNFFALAVFSKRVTTQVVDEGSIWDNNGTLSLQRVSNAHSCGMNRKLNSDEFIRSTHEQHTRVTSPFSGFTVQSPLSSRDGRDLSVRCANFLPSVFYREAINCRLPENSDSGFLTAFQLLKLDESVKEVIQKNRLYEMASEKYFSVKPTTPRIAKYNELSFYTNAAKATSQTMEMLRSALVSDIYRARSGVGGTYLIYLDQRASLITSQKELEEMLRSRETSFDRSGELVATDYDISRDGQLEDVVYPHQYGTKAVERIGIERLQNMQGVYLVKPTRAPSAVCMTFTKGYGNVSCVSCDVEGQLVVAGCLDGSLRIFDYHKKRSEDNATGITRLVGHDAAITSAACSSDSKWLLSGDVHGCILLWAPRLRTGDSASTCYSRPLCVYKGHFGPVWCIAWNNHSPGMFATGGRDGTVRVWLTHQTCACRILVGHTADTTSIQFTSNGTQLLTGSRDGTCRLWNVAEGECVQTFGGHSSEVNAVAVSLSNQLIATGTVNGVIKLWAPSVNQCLRTIYGAHRSPITALKWSICQSVLISASTDGCVRCWGVNSCLEGLDSAILSGYFHRASDTASSKKPIRGGKPKRGRSKSPEESGTKKKKQSSHKGKNRSNGDKVSQQFKSNKTKTDVSESRTGKRKSKLGQRGSFLRFGVQLALAYLRKTCGIGSLRNTLFRWGESSPVSQLERARQLLMHNQAQPDRGPLFTEIGDSGLCLSEWWTLDSSVLDVHVTGKNLVVVFATKNMHFHRKQGHKSVS